MKSVWLVTVGEPLIGPLENRAPLRTGQLALVLRDAGWDVTWWTSGFDHFRKRRFSEQERRAAESVGVKLQWLDGLAYRRNVSLWRQWNHIQLALSFRRAARALPTPSVIAVAYPPIELASAVASYAQRRAIPLLVDVRDLWPEVFAWAAPAGFRRAAKVATYPLRFVGAGALRRADALVGVSAGYLKWALQRAGRERRTVDTVIPIFGPPPRAVARDAGLPSRIDPTRLLAVFVGTFGRSYDLATVIRAARMLRREVAARLQIVIAGEGEDRAKLEASSRDLEHVVFTGWIDRDQVAALLTRASAGLAAYAPGALQGVPNKIVDYLSFGLPIINSLQGECAEILSRSGTGWNYEAANAKDLSGVLTQFVLDSRDRDLRADNARLLFADQFDPAVSQRRYRDLLVRLAESPAVRPDRDRATAESNSVSPMRH